MKKLHLSLVLLCLMMSTCHELMAQEPNFSMYHYTPFLTNPGRIGVQEDVKLMLNYRNQAIDVGENFTTSMLSGYYPVNVGNHRLVIGGTFLSDNASEFIKTNGGMLGVAYSIHIARGMELSFGAQGGYFHRRVESDFTTDDQFINGEFDPNAPSSETAMGQTKGYPTISSGMHWQWKDAEGRVKAFAGGAIFNFTEPNTAFIEPGDANLPLSIRGSAGLRVYQGMKFSVMPSVRWISQAGNSYVNTGSWFRYELASTEQGTNQIGLGLWYNSNDAGVVSLEYNQPNLTVAASYDLPVSTERSAIQTRGIVELAIAFRLKKGKKKQRKEVSERSEVVEAVEETKSEEEALPEKVEEEEVEKEVLAQETEEIKSGEEPSEGTPLQEEPVQDVKKEKEVQEQPDEAIPGESKKVNPPVLSESDLAILSQTVKFKLNSYDLTDDSKAFLDEVTGVLKRNDWLDVELVGHACDLGPEKLNDDLSVKRADKVKRYLLEKGIVTSRINITGEGEKKPIDTSGTEEGRRVNRRVEFRVVE
ncbi:type IX secretion system membrane protein PorP/SprF [Fulvivirga sp. M361]|uniref:PorP/SprF family type IX secretion system membrane protein n=1 Tax=Fulvivirga sp. M361 TaxID=2594266 RepID=UPI00117B3936|nr:PorP/SprF family type IX secretion system membrane protein [Fulvivirga sp. M361]TRX53379.1 type IX secretion system membrane protein PorP/SprF [Fulvivirga sp. M361]